MKTFGFLILFFYSATAFSQAVKSGDVPENVRAELKTIRPDAKNISWVHFEDGYRASYTVKKVKESVLIDAEAVWLDTRTDIPVSALPDSVMIYMHMKFPDIKPEKFMKVVPISDLVFYYVQTGNTFYIFDEKGIYMRTDEEEKPAE
jgi:hypothetical protein